MTDMLVRRLSVEDLPQLTKLHVLYKQEIGEDAPSQVELQRLRDAMAAEKILFFGCERAGKLLGICSVTKTFSTFCYGDCGVFEDFYILPEARHQGLARALAAFAWEASGVSAMTVGCADCDRSMYEAIGFRLRLGQMLAWGE